MFINGISHRRQHMPRKAAALATERTLIRERAAKNVQPPAMHNIEASQNFNAPLDGTNLHFCKLLPIGPSSVSRSAQGINAGSRMKSPPLSSSNS
jgi:hypothetical protein